MSESVARPSASESVIAQLRGWKLLRTLHPLPIDLSRLALIRDADPRQLATPRGATQLVIDLGLNDEGLAELPQSLHRHCGGLRIWQNPMQFGPYLQHLVGLNVRSYLEIGVRHGGSFVATLEYLQRFCDLELAVGVDIIPAPTLETYAQSNSRVHLTWVDSTTPPFRELLAEMGPFDLAFIDSHHEEHQCQREVELLSESTNMIALHDITNIGCPGVGRVWTEFTASSDWECVEFTEQFEGLGPFMGIGLAVKRSRSFAGSPLTGGD